MKSPILTIILTATAILSLGTAYLVHSKNVDGGDKFVTVCHAAHGAVIQEYQTGDLLCIPDGTQQASEKEAPKSST